ncbi:hypothetical protein ACHAW6_001764 [Cyclotella cf. meneghiniana]
MAPNPVHISG